MTSETPPSPTSSFGSSAFAARFLLAALAVLSSALPYLHYRYIEGRLDAVRYPWGLLPVEYASLQNFGRVSAWFPFLSLAAFGWSYKRPAMTAVLLRTLTGAMLVFTVVYVCNAVLIVAILLANRSI